MGVSGPGEGWEEQWAGKHVPHLMARSPLTDTLSQPSKNTSAGQAKWATGLPAFQDMKMQTTAENLQHLSALASGSNEASLPCKSYSTRCVTLNPSK